MILLLLEKIRNTNNPGFIPLLKAWQEIDYKKVRNKIQEVIDYLNNQKPVRQYSLSLLNTPIGYGSLSTVVKIRVYLYRIAGQLG